MAGPGEVTYSVSPDETVEMPQPERNFPMEERIEGTTGDPSANQYIYPGQQGASTSTPFNQA
jgi:hypothetical protein